MKSRAIALVGILLVCVVAVSAQTTATIVGTVTDPSGAVVPGVGITVVQKDTGLTRKTASNANGYFAVPSLPVGEYSVTAEITGFKRQTVSGIVLQVTDERAVNIVLDVGQVTESVTVSGQAIALQSESAVVGQVIDQRFNSNIPLNGRDFSQLILLTPGATNRPGATASTTGAATGSLGSGVSIGGRDNQNNFTMDGASNNARQFGNIAIKPSIDAIQEFKVQANSYSAEHGFSAFGQVNLVTKSGTNSFHGALFEFVRNNFFDARNFFQPSVAKLSRNQFGAAIGGPVWKNHTFFFFNWESLRERRGVTSFRSVPVEPWRQGDFSGLAGLTLRDPSTGQPFTGNRIPTARFSRTATAALNVWPKQNFGDTTRRTQNLIVGQPDRTDDDQFTVKIDHELTAKGRLTGRYSRVSREDTSTPLLPSFEQIIPPRNIVASLAYTHIFTPQLLGEFRFAFARSEFVQSSPNTGKVGFYDQFGINNPLASPTFEGAPSLTFTNAPTVTGNATVSLTALGEGDFNTQRDISNEFNPAGSLSWTRGNHTMKLGFTITRYQQNTPGPVTGLRRGSFSFRGDFTGHPFADFLLGIPYSASRVVGKGVETGRSTWHGYYFADDWKMSRKLTLNIGLRYEYVSPLLDVLDRRSTFWPLTNAYNTGMTGQVLVADPKHCTIGNRPCAGVGEVLGFDGVARRAAYKADRNNWAPRFGFAYSWDPKTVIRGGYGVFFTNSQNFLNNFVINRRQPPFAETQTVTSSTATPQINIANPFINAAAALVIGTQNINPNFVEGYTQHWNLTVQRELPFGITMDVGYVANKGTKLGELTFYNVPTLGPSATLQSRRPFPTWSTALSLDSWVTSNYNSLQIKGQRRTAKGMSLLGAYTWSKSIDLSSERGAGSRGGTFDGTGDARNLRNYARGLSGFDTRHRFVMSSVYELPVGRGKWLLKNAGPVLDKIVGGWEVSGIGVYQSGFPFTVVQSGDPNGDGILDRPDLVGPVRYNTRNPNCYVVDSRNPACGVSTSAFVNLPAASLRFGSGGRNTLIGPGFVTRDIAVAKNTRFGERYNLQFRAEFFNLFNRANFNQPQATINVTSPAFGSINSAGRSRELQFGLKLEF